MEDQSTLNREELRQQKYYDSIAEVYDQHYSHPYALKYRYSIFERFLKGIDLQRCRVLDAMCGGGENTGYFLSKGANVSGLDLSPKQCEIYHSRYSELEVTCASVTSTGLPDETFDLIVTDSLHHTHPRLNETVAELWRILKPNGRLMFWEPSAGSIINVARRLWYKFDGTYFESNEAAISVTSLSLENSELFQLERSRFGGNLAYLLVQESMIFRIPPGLIRFYARPLIFIDSLIERCQSELTSCWVLALMRKV